MKNKKGQSLIEATLLSFVLILSIKGFFILFWMIVNLLWAEHQLYQGLICRAEKRPLSICETRVLNQIQKLNLTGKWSNLKITERNQQWKGFIKWKFYKWTFLVKSQLHL